MAKRHPGVGSINVPPFDAIADPRKAFWVKDDFVSGGTTSGTIGALGWNLGGTGGAVAYTAQANRPGILTLTAATTAFSADINLQVDTLNRPSAKNSLYTCFGIRIPTALTNRTVRVGLRDAAGTTSVRPDQHVSVEYAAAVDADDWLVVTDDNVTELVYTAPSDIAAPLADTWYTVEIALTSSSVMAWINGDSLLNVEQTASLPATQLTPYVHVGNGAAGQTLDVDFVALVQQLNRKGFN